MSILESTPLNLLRDSADLCYETHAHPANDVPYWPSCMRDPGFLPWLSRFMTIVKNTRPDTPMPTLMRMARRHGSVPPDWRLAVLFLMEHTRKH